MLRNMVVKFHCVQFVGSSLLIEILSVLLRAMLIGGVKVLAVHEFCVELWCALSFSVRKVHLEPVRLGVQVYWRVEDVGIVECLLLVRVVVENFAATSVDSSRS